MSHRREKAFTLIEVLVSMAIFGVLALLAYLTLAQTIDNAADLNARMDRLQSIQRTMRHLSHDLMSAAPRPVRDPLGDSYMPAVMVSTANDFLLAVTHGGWSNPAGLPRSTLQRSVYKLEEDKLVRAHYTVLDSTYANDLVSTQLLDGVERLEFRMIRENGDVSLQWPPQGAGNPVLRPRAVEIVLTMTDEGEIRRIVEVAS